MSISLLLIAVNRVSGLVLPAATKFLIDGVITQRRIQLLLPLVGAVVLATAIQGCSSFVLTQSLSKAAQRLIGDLRVRVQAQVSRLPVAYYDANNTGALVARVMNDVSLPRLPNRELASRVWSMSSRPGTSRAGWSSKPFRSRTARPATFQ